MTNLFFKPTLLALLSLFLLASCSKEPAEAVAEEDANIYTLYPDFSMAQEKNQLILEQVSMRLDEYSQRLSEDPKAAPAIAKELQDLQSTVDKQREENQQSRDIKDIVESARGAIASWAPCIPECPPPPPCEVAGKCREIRLKRDQLVLLLPAPFEKHTFSLESAEGALIAEPTEVKASPGGQVRVEMTMLQPDYQGPAAFYAKRAEGSEVPDFFASFDFQPPR
ncbi:hypothetical protein [Phaeodactylibacter sp.]|uniref:hypothetical protein n=1 Tax=Phaeodactylibacter sp. TaxID=1940289 RepID=UPI0025FE2E26|nr:hypothetical protein [Phaeodactylibacter sp.]MCI4650367.1 hypothetical protein [Phaeodactylibacter sp.]MCI5094510.1 hypothetical protein [Phaeodactylibacter sp.]